MLGEPSSGQNPSQVIPKIEKPPCQVCGYPHARLSYGVVLCLGCKGFFKKSIIGQMKYRCSKDGKCVINCKKSLTLCRACRFKKCESIGLDKHSIKPRTGSRFHEPKNAELEVMEMNEDFKEKLSVLEVTPEITIAPEPRLQFSNQNQSFPNLETPQCVPPPSHYRTFF